MMYPVSVSFRDAFLLLTSMSTMRSGPFLVCWYLIVALNFHSGVMILSRWIRFLYCVLSMFIGGVTCSWVVATSWMSCGKICIGILNPLICICPYSTPSSVEISVISTSWLMTLGFNVIFRYDQSPCAVIITVLFGVTTSSFDTVPVRYCVTSFALRCLFVNLGYVVLCGDHNL